MTAGIRTRILLSVTLMLTLSFALLSVVSIQSYTENATKQITRTNESINSTFKRISEIQNDSLTLIEKRLDKNSKAYMAQFHSLFSKSRGIPSSSELILLKGSFSENTELYIIGADGTVSSSTRKEDIGFDMFKVNGVREFLTSLKDTSEAYGHGKNLSYIDKGFMKVYYSPLPSSEGWIGIGIYADSYTGYDDIINELAYLKSFKKLFGFVADVNLYDDKGIPYPSASKYGESLSGERLGALKNAVKSNTTSSTSSGELHYFYSHVNADSGISGDKIVELVIDDSDARSEIAANIIADLSIFITALIVILIVVGKFTNRVYERMEQMKFKMVESEKVASINSLSVGICHEVNTPLGVSITSSSFASSISKKFLSQISEGAHIRRSSLDDFISQISESADILKVNLNKGMKLIQMFEYSNLGNEYDTSSEIRIRSFISDEMPDICDEFGIGCECVSLVCRSDIRLNANASVLRLILRVLVSNTVKHGFGEGFSNTPKIRIEISSDRYDEVLSIRYSDNGSGIPHEIRDSIFTPFFTTKRSGGHLGLGLSIAHLLASKKLRGNIEICDSSESKTCFVISVPIMKSLSSGGACVE